VFQEPYSPSEQSLESKHVLRDEAFAILRHSRLRTSALDRAHEITNISATVRKIGGNHQYPSHCERLSSFLTTLW
jgi:hypothetical protein